MSLSYADKLRDPRWQKKRLEILERDKWTCAGCKSTEKTLHVHHRLYVKGLDPWEYDSEYLLTVCDECHSAATEIITEFDRVLKLFFLPNQLRSLTESIEMSSDSPIAVTIAISELLGDEHLVRYLVSRKLSRIASNDPERCGEVVALRLKLGYA